MTQSLQPDTIHQFLNGLELGQPYRDANLTLYPVFFPQEAKACYFTSADALKQGVVRVTEVNDAGSVTKLKVTNSADTPVLFLEGEGLVGARQNRVLNTSILLPEKSETIIPVSCTERGRWSYKTRQFSMSDHFMSPSLRKSKSASVSHLMQQHSAMPFVSNQGMVWQEVHAMANACCCRSETDALEDVLNAKAAQFTQQAAERFPLQNQQRGLLVFINGKPAGMDVVSRAEAYAVYHQRFVRSYLLDACLKATQDSPAPTPDTARQFLDTAVHCPRSSYPSVGRGIDHRLEGKEVNGLALDSDQEIIHLALFGS